MQWIDVHTHLNFIKSHTVEQALELAAQAGVDRLITIGTEPADHTVVLGLARQYFPRVACTLGCHPHEAHLYTDEVKQFFIAHLGEKGVVAVGEIGLDYYYSHSPHDVQQQSFRQQLQLAVEHKMPVEIHTRDAEADTIAILKEFGGQVTGIVHCFTGTQWLADETLALGLDISISGVVTFKKAEELRQVVRSVPLTRLHVETDAPFLAPMPHRGQENHPALVTHTAQCVADLKQVSLAQLSQQTRINAQRTFPKLQLQ